MTIVDRLQTLLNNVGAGPIPTSGLADIRLALSECWQELETDGGGMKPDKVGRWENVRWVPPELSFDIVRHGGMVAGGSGRGEIQNWQVNLVTRTAVYSQTGYRQIYPMDARFDAKSAAAEIAELVCLKGDDRRLRWRADGSVAINTGLVVPETNKQTTLGRRKRFASELKALLTAKGWVHQPAGSHLIFRQNAK